MSRSRSRSHTRALRVIDRPAHPDYPRAVERPMDPGPVLAALHRNDWGRIVATLLRTIRDVDLAEECAQEAFSIAIERWRGEGVPEHPRAWLVATARHKALDRIRRRRVESEHVREEAVLLSEMAPEPGEIGDDRLRLLFTCCHPALAPEAQVALTLRTLGGLTAEEIARAFLVPVATMQQRIVRAKALLEDRRIPYEVPETRELGERMPAVLTTLYLIFNEGHSASQGEALLRLDLSEEAISLGRALVQGLPSASGPVGLLGLFLLTHARRRARVDANGDLVTLDEQDRSLWDHAMADEGRALVRRALGMAPLTRFAIQGAIAAVHADAERAEETNWAEIAALYNVHLRIAPSPIVALNAAVAHALSHDVGEGLRAVEALAGELSSYAPFHAARADLLRRLGRAEASRAAFLRASELAGTAPERRHLRRKAGVEPAPEAERSGSGPLS